MPLKKKFLAVFYGLRAFEASLLLFRKEIEDPKKKFKKTEFNFSSFSDPHTSILKNIRLNRMNPVKLENLLEILNEINFEKLKIDKNDISNSQFLSVLEESSKNEFKRSLRGFRGSIKNPAFKRWSLDTLKSKQFF